MKAIVIVGSHGAGKETVLGGVINQLDVEIPGKVSLAKFYRTRPLRPDEKQGENAMACTEQQFEEMIKNGELAYFDKAEDPITGPYRVGTTWAELGQNDYIITEASDKCALELKEKASDKGGQTFLIYLHAPKEQRIGRMQFRDSWLFPERYEARLENDPTDPDPEKHKNFDCIIENIENQEKETIKVVLDKIREFIKETENETINEK